MNLLIDLLKTFNDLFNNDNIDLSILNDNSKFDNLSKLDLSKEEDYKKIMDIIKYLKDNPSFGLLGGLFGIDNDYLSELSDYVKKEHEKLVHENNKNNKCPYIQKKIEDKSVVNDSPIRPSLNIDTQVGLQIHKLVQEYVDTMIKPYNPNPGGLTTKQINDVYAGLYEFAAWIYNK